MIDLRRKDNAIRGFWEWLFIADPDGDRGISNLLDPWNAGGAALSAVDLLKNRATCCSCACWLVFCLGG
jgi:hypothetical protein